LADTRLRFNTERKAPKQGKYLFSGLLVCKCGGGKLYCYPHPGMTAPRYTCRSCKTKVDEAVIEKSLQYLLKTLSLSPESLCSDLNSENKLIENQNRLGFLKKDLRQINSKVDTLVDLVGTGRIDKETFSSRFDPLTVRRDSISLEISRLQGENDYIQSEETGRQFVVTQATTLAKLWAELTYDTRASCKSIFRELNVLYI